MKKQKDNQKENKKKNKNIEETKEIKEMLEKDEKVKKEHKQKNKKEKKKEKVKKERKYSKLRIVCWGVLILVVILAISLVVYFSCFSKEAKLKKQEEELTELLRGMGEDFYENYYYKMAGETQEEKVSYLSKYSTNGVRINIDNLSRYNSKVNKGKAEKFVNKVSNEKCDLNESIVTIIPKEPYGEKNYDLKVTLICGFGTLEELQLEASKKNIADYDKMNKDELKEAIELYDLKEKAKEKNIEGYENMSIKELKKALKK